MTGRGTDGAGEPRRRALCVATDVATRGGISSYVRMLSETELWTRWNIRHVVTHRDGSAMAKVGTFAVGLMRYLVALSSDRPDVVHVHMSSYGSFVRKAVVVGLAKAARVPVLVHVHGSEFAVFHDRLPAPLRRLVAATLNAADVVVALGDEWAGRLRTIAPRARVETVPNGVRVPELPPAVDRSPLRVVFLGQIGERKGAFTLLEAWAKLATDPAAIPAALLTLAGDGEVERARQRIVALSIDGSAEVRSWLSPDEVAQLLAEADVFVLPSRSEGQPIALLEAMARGLCVIAGDVGGIPDMIDDGRSGLLVPADDVEALGAALRRVLRDPQLRRTLGAEARADVLARFDLDVVWRRFDAFYSEVSGR